MRGSTTVALMQAMRWRFAGSERNDPRDQFVNLRIGLEERTQVEPAIPEQAQVQLAVGG